MADLNALVELAKLAASRHDERRKYEWKISLSFWALIVGAILKKSDLQLQYAHVLVGIIAGLLYTFLWIRGIWVANQNDKKLVDHFRDAALAKIRNSNCQLGDIPPKIKVWSLTYWFGFLLDWAMLFHIAVTGALIAAFYFIN